MSRIRGKRKTRSTSGCGETGDEPRINRREYVDEPGHRRFCSQACGKTGFHPPVGGWYPIFLGHVDNFAGNFRKIQSRRKYDWNMTGCQTVSLCFFGIIWRFPPLAQESWLLDATNEAIRSVDKPVNPFPIAVIPVTHRSTSKTDSLYLYLYREG